MLIIEDVVNCTVINAVLGIASADCLIVQIRDLIENASRKKVVFYKTHQPFYGSFGKRMPCLAQFCFKAEISHKQFIIFLPDWVSLFIAPEHDIFHVVRQDIFRDSHIQKRMDHSDKQVLLLHAWKKLNILLLTAMADHGETGDFISIASCTLHFNESPAHLVKFSRCGMVTLAPAALRRYKLPFGRYKFFMAGNILFNDGQAALKVIFP